MTASLQYPGEVGGKGVGSIVLWLCITSSWDLCLSLGDGSLSVGFLWASCGVSPPSISTQLLQKQAVFDVLCLSVTLQVRQVCIQWHMYNQRTTFLVLVFGVGSAGTTSLHSVAAGTVQTPQPGPRYLAPWT